MTTRSQLRFAGSIVPDLILLAYWIAFAVTVTWMASNIMPMRLDWWAEIGNEETFFAKLELKIYLGVFFWTFCLLTGLWAHVAINRIRTAEYRAFALSQDAAAQ